MAACRVLLLVSSVVFAACVMPRIQLPVARPQEARLETDRVLLADGAVLPLARWVPTRDAARRNRRPPWVERLPRFVGRSRRAALAKRLRGVRVRPARLRRDRAARHLGWRRRAGERRPTGGGARERTPSRHSALRSRREHGRSGASPRARAAAARLARRRRAPRAGGLEPPRHAVVSALRATRPAAHLSRTKGVSAAGARAIR